MYVNQTQQASENSVRSNREEMLDNSLKELISNVTTYIPHELRTPLVSILGFTQIIMDECDTMCRNDLHYMMNHINKSSKRLYTTIEKFINFAEIECISKDEKMKKELEENNLQSHTATVKEMVIFMAEKESRRSDLTVDIEDAELAIPDQYLKLISKELFDNALKFSKTGTRLEVRGKKCEFSYLLEIEDHGIGIHQDDINRIEPFRQFNRKTLQQDGNGLGLAIVKRLAEVFNCQFEIKSQKDSYTVVSIDFTYKHKYRKVS